MYQVSVITITYNAEKNIEETMRSVLGQKYFGFEYIIKDGNSSDKTNEVVDEIKLKYDKNNVIKHICTSDNGIYDAMNEAVTYASGEWIIFMNAGDTFYDRNVLSDVFSVQYKKEIGVLYGHALMKLTRNRGMIVTYNLDMMKNGVSICHQSVFEKRKLLLQMPFDNGMKILADRKHLLQLMNDGIKFQRINIIVAQEDRNGISATNYLQCYKENKALCEQYNLYCSKRSILFQKIKELIKVLVPQIEEIMMISKVLKRNSQVAESDFKIEP